MFKKMSMPFAFFFCLIFLISGCIFTGNGKDDGTVVVTIGNEKVFEPEFKYYLYLQEEWFESIGGRDIWETQIGGMPAPDFAKEQALTAITRIRITAAKASSVSINLSKEEKEEARINAAIALENIGGANNPINLTIDELSAIMEQSKLHDKVYDAVTNDFVPSDSEFLNYWQARKEEYIGYYDSPDDEEFKESLRRSYINEKKDDIFTLQFERWLTDFTIEKNQEVWDRINRSGMPIS